MPANPQQQLEHFRTAVELLGGKRAAARLIGCNERTMRAVYHGERALHDGWLRDIARGLADLADRCRIAERRLTPAFRENLTAAQLERMGQGDARRFDARAPLTEAELRAVEAVRIAADVSPNTVQTILPSGEIRKTMCIEPGAIVVFGDAAAFREDLQRRAAECDEDDQADG